GRGARVRNHPRCPRRPRIHHGRRRGARHRAGAPPLIRSMTGFGEASLHTQGVHYHLEVRSLNNRYFKASIRLPDDLQGLEAELEAALRARITRGALVLIGKVSDTSGGAAQVVNESALR